MENCDTINSGGVLFVELSLPQDVIAKMNKVVMVFLKHISLIYILFFINSIFINKHKLSVLKNCNNNL